MQLLNTLLKINEKKKQYKKYLSFKRLNKNDI